MKLARWGDAGQEKPGVIDRNGTMRDLSGEIADINAQVLAGRSLDKLASLDFQSLPVVPQGQRLGPCIGGVSHFIAIGLNFKDHARETGQPEPKEPIVFSKAPSCISGPNDDIPIPPDSDRLDWELELAVIIGEEAYCITENEARSVIAGYCICHDVSERTFQIDRGGQWIKGKSAPGFGPLGPWLVTRDEVADVQNLGMSLAVNGRTMQSGTTADMIFGVDFLVSYLSRFMKLRPGDVITTGTPAGVGLGMKPQRFLTAGDIVSLAIDGLGTQRQTVVPS